MAMRLGTVMTALIAQGLVASVVLALGLVMSSAPSFAAEPDEQEAAAGTLRKAGLEPAGERWLLPAELRLQRRFAALDRWHREALASGKKLELWISTQAAIRNEIVALQTTQRQLSEAQAAQPDQAQIGLRLRKIAARLKLLTTKRLSPSELVNRQEVRAEMTRQISACNRIILLEIAAPRRVRELTAAYQKLSADEAIRGALATLGGQERLEVGPAYAGQWLQLANIASEVLPDRWPVYGQNGRWRTSLIIEQRQSATVTIFEDTKERPYPAWLPASVLQAAGIKIPENAPYLELRLPSGRRVPTRVLRLSYLQLGKHRIGGAEVLSLLPEDEDLGGQISLQFLEKHGLRLDQDPLPAVVGR